MDDKQMQGQLEQALKMYKEEFQFDYEYTSRHTKSFSAIMKEIIEKEKATYFKPTGKKIHKKISDRNTFAEVTGLGPSTYDRIKSGSDDYVPSLKTLMTLCMVYQLNMTMVRELRRSYGYDFNAKDRTHQAYIYLLVCCRGKSLNYCNQVLRALGVEEKYYLGDGTIVDGITV